MRLLLGVLVCLLCPVASADEVRLTDGRKLAGQARWTDDGLLLTHPHGVLLIDREQVEEVVRRPSPRKQLATEFASLPKGDVEGALRIVQRALDLRLRKEACTLLLQLAAQDPAQVEVIELLRKQGYAKEQGAWVAPEDRGLALFKGRWVDAQAAAKARAERKERHRLERELERARKTRDRLLEKRRRTRKTAATAERTVERACVQQAYSPKEEAAVEALRARDQRVKQTLARLAGLRKELKTMWKQPCPDEPHGCFGCDVGCALGRLEFSLKKRMDEQEQKLKARRKSRSKALKYLRETIEPTRVAAEVAQLRLAERRRAEAKAELDAAQKALDLLEKQLAEN